MRFRSRKLTFQLTPLLDLLLIVIFAQYMEVRETSAEQLNEVERAKLQVASLRDDHRRSREQLVVARMQLEELEIDTTKLRDQLTKRKLELTERLRQALDRQEEVGDIVAELFKVPEELVEKALKPRSPADQPRSPQEIEQLQRSFRELAGKRGREVIKHVLTFEELRKRCDIWEIYIAEEGSVFLNTESETHEFRATTTEEFQSRLFERYKALPQPKGLVIILLSYGDARAGIRQAALDGLPQAAERMRADTSGRTRFEYAILGFSPEKPEARSE